MAFVTQDQKRRAEIKYFVTRGNDGVPTTAILSVEDKTEQKQIEERYRFINTLLDFSEGSKAMFVINLSAGSVEFESDRSLTSLSQVSGGQDFSHAARLLIKEAVYEEDIKTCTRFFKTEGFLAEFDAENYEKSLDFRYKNKAGDVRWCNVHTRLIRDTYTGEIKLHVLFVDIHEQKLAELALLRRAQTDSLTGLINRESFAEEVGQRCAQIRQESLYNAIIM